MLRYLLAVIFFALIISLSATEVTAEDKKARANDGVVTNWGKPNNFSIGKINAFWVWCENDVWHIRTTGGGKGTHRFQGQIIVSGGKLSGLQGNSVDVSKKSSDRFIFNPKKTALAFDFKTDEGVDGIDFKVDNADARLTFAMILDGESHPKHIHVGKAGDHPPTAIFYAPGQPLDLQNKNGKGKKK